MKNASDEVARWRATINDLSGRRENAAKRIVELGEKKAPLTLGACTGDGKAREKLDGFNSQLLIERQAEEDLALAIEQAQVELGKADDALRAEEKAERLRQLDSLAQKRVQQAAAVDQAVRALGLTLGAYFDTGTTMTRVLGSSNDGIAIAQKVRQRGRAEYAVAEHLVALLPGIITHNPRDFRRGQSLEDMETAQLQNLLLTAKGVAAIAGTEAAA